MKPDDMLRQAKGTLDNITELASRLSALERQYGTANAALDDACLRLSTALRIDVGECPLEDITAAVEKGEARRRELEAAVRHVVQTLTEPRFPPLAAEEARIELARLLPPEPPTNGTQ